MKSLLISPNDDVRVIDLDGLDGVIGMMRDFDLVNLGDGTLMAGNGIGLTTDLPQNRRAILFVASMIDVFIPISGSVIVFTDTNEDLDLKSLPQWVQQAIAAPFN